MKKALINVDVQNDFMPKGKLAVKDGDLIVPVINSILENNSFDLIVFSKDFHPANHKCFVSQNAGKKQGDIIEVNGEKLMVWNDHCVQNTIGGDFHKDLKMPTEYVLVEKGDVPELHPFSAFGGTNLTEILQLNDIDTVFITGLALDFCVKSTALDAVKNFKTVVILDATKAVFPENNEATIKELVAAGVKIKKQ